MKHETRIAAAFAANDIRSVLVVDDAYDPPDLDDGAFAALLDLLDEEANRKRIAEGGIGEDVLDTARQATDGGDDALGNVYRCLYRAFVVERNALDPGGHFERMRGVALRELQPLHALLKKCGAWAEDVQIETIGLEDGFARYEETRPQVLFLDYYLTNDVPPVGDVRGVALRGARQRSLEFLKSVVEVTQEHDYPAIVLMSSRRIGDGETFREQAGDKIVPLRFRVLHKRGLWTDDGSVALDHSAADALLDTFQGYRFGELFQRSLSTWKDGVQAALEEFEREVRQWDRRDIAYLSRFRLREEEQPLSEYLEWLFGGYFGALMERHVDWGHDAIRKLEGDDKIGSDLEGAYEGATDGVARCFHGVRVRTQRVGPGYRYRLGDLYVKRGCRTVWAIVTPDCDLVMRAKKTKAVRILALGGVLKEFDDEGAAVDNFVLMEKRPFSVSWKPKDLKTFPLDGEGSLRSGEYEFIGTLRGLYAQAIQRHALADLWRVGVPVAPTLGIRVGVSGLIRQRGGQFGELSTGEDAKGVLIPPREGRPEGGRVLLARPFVWGLVEALQRYEHGRLGVEDSKALKRVLAEEEDFCEWILKEGGIAKDVGRFGVGFSMGEPTRKRKKNAWLWLVVSVPDQ